MRCALEVAGKSSLLLPLHLALSVCGGHLSISRGAVTRFEPAACKGQAPPPTQLWNARHPRSLALASVPLLSAAATKKKHSGCIWQTDIKSCYLSLPLAISFITLYSFFNTLPTVFSCPDLIIVETSTATNGVIVCPVMEWRNNYQEDLLIQP